MSTVSKESVTTVRIYGKTSEGIVEDFRSFYFDLALSSSEAVLKLVLDVITHDHILYGKLLLMIHSRSFLFLIILQVRTSLTRRLTNQLASSKF
jgi:hypothetical protein